jgi:TRAP transporter TAXI family solute receptor
MNLAKIAVFAALLGLVCGSAGAADSPSPAHTPAKPPLIIGTGAVTGIYFPAAGAVQRLVNDQNTGLRLAVESTNGSVSNLQNLINGNLDLAVAQSDWAFYATKGGQNPFLKPNTDLRTLLALHAELMAVIVKADSGINDLDGLKGKRINLGPAGSGPRTIMTAVFQTLNWSINEMGSILDLPFAEQSAALCEGRVDAIVFLVPHPNAAVQEALARCPTKLLPLSGRAVDTLVSTNPFYSKNPIPGGSYPSASADVPSFGVRALLLTTTRLPENSAYTIAKAVMSNTSALGGLHPSLARLTATDMKAGNFGTPLHPGVEKYLTEAGVTAPAPKP